LNANGWRARRQATTTERRSDREGWRARIENDSRQENKTREGGRDGNDVGSSGAGCARETAERVRKGAEGGADIGAVVQCRFLVAASLRDFDILFSVRESMEQRRVLREKQRGNQQQAVEQSGHLS
jgi:hypothetical protein